MTLSSLNVLLVEDDALVRFVHQQYLLELGCKVTLAVTGTEAVEKAKQKFDVILMDIGLPELDGLEATALIREQEKTSHHRATIIALTGYSGTEMHEACLARGMNAVWVKPLWQDDFKNRLENC